VTFDDLTPQSCRWIDGDPLDGGTFCGARRRDAKTAYCAAHHKRAYYLFDDARAWRTTEWLARKTSSRRLTSIVQPLMLPPAEEMLA
jgi:hypothetical protein